MIRAIAVPVPTTAGAAGAWVDVSAISAPRTILGSPHSAGRFNLEMSGDLIHATIAAYGLGSAPASITQLAAPYVRAVRVVGTQPMHCTLAGEEVRDAGRSVEYVGAPDSAAAQATDDVPIAWMHGPWRLRAAAVAVAADVAANPSGFAAWVVTARDAANGATLGDVCVVDTSSVSVLARTRQLMFALDYVVGLGGELLTLSVLKGGSGVQLPYYGVYLHLE